MSALVESKNSLKSFSRTSFSRKAVSRTIGAIAFNSLLMLIVLTAIPYGAAEPWWKAFFECLVFVLAGLCVIEKLVWTEAPGQNLRLFVPIFVLLAFAFIQTISWSGSAGNAIDKVSRTISADAFQTRLFIIHISALVVVVWLLRLQTNSQKRLRRLVELVIATGFLSACFGLLRQASQREAGFFLPNLEQGFGYAQFINPNHFAFLMEMTLGLTLGIVVSLGVTGRRLALYIIAAVPMWIALVLSNSRGGLLSILCQLLFLGLIFLSPRSEHARGKTETPDRSFLRTSRLFAIRGILIVALLSAAIVTVVFVGGDPLAAKLEAVPVELSRTTADSYVLRQNIWRATWDLIKDHPIAGVGFGGYWIEITKYHNASGEVTPQEAHNDYLELLASGGVIGLAIATWFTFVFVGAVRRQLRVADHYRRAVTLGALAGILTVSVHSLVDFGLHITINALVFVVLISLATIDTPSPNIKEFRAGGRTDKSLTQRLRVSILGGSFSKPRT